MVFEKFVNKVKEFVLSLLTNLSDLLVNLFNWLKKFSRKIRGAIPIIILVGLLVLGFRYAGWLQPWEWNVLDIYFRQRPAEPMDTRFVIVGITESDITAAKDYPFTDYELATLLEKIESQNPRIIGLDIYRDLPVQPEYKNGGQKLADLLENNPKIVGVTKIVGLNREHKVPPNPILEKYGRYGANDTILDEDKVTRRAFFFPLDEPIPSFGLILAAEYLREEGITYGFSDDGKIKLGELVFNDFDDFDGGYINAIAGYSQIFLNWRTPPSNFKTVSVGEVLSGKVPQNLMTDKIVIIGAAAPSLKDIFFSPYSWNYTASPSGVYGVYLNANITSQFISAVKDGRPLIKVWAEWQEILWVLWWISFTAISIWRLGNSRNVWDFEVGQKKGFQNWPDKIKAFRFYTLSLFLSGTAAIVVISFTLFEFLRAAWWLPVVPPLLGIFGAFILTTRAVYVSKLKQAHETLSLEVKKQTTQIREQKEELQNYTNLLEQKNQQLKETQAELIIKEKDAALGTLAGGLAHAMRNPVHLLALDVEGAIRETKGMQELIAQNSYVYGDYLSEIFAGNEELLPHLEESLVHGLHQVHRLDQMIHSIWEHSRGKKNFHFTRIEINSFIEETFKLIEQENNSRHSLSIVVEKSYDRSIGQIGIIKEEIERALIAIGENAGYALNKQREIIGEEFKPTIWVSTKNLEETIEIRVKDNGTGIPQQDLEKVFIPFHTGKPSGEGTGLGLYFTYEIIVNEHRGKISVDSEIGKYTEFLIVLPKKFRQQPHVAETKEIKD